MRKAFHIGSILLLAVAMIMAVRFFVMRLENMGEVYEYTRSEVIRERMFIVGIGIAMISFAGMIVGALSGKMYFRKAAYVGLFFYGVELLIWEFVDVYRGFYNRFWDKLRLVAFLAIPIIAIMLFVSAKSVGLTTVIVAIVSCILLVIYRSSEAIEVPAIIAGVMLNILDTRPKKRR